MPFDGVDLQRAVLGRAIELIEKGWTRGTLARDARRRPVPWWAESAVRFCARGAIYRAWSDLGTDWLMPLDRGIWDNLEEANDCQTSKHTVIAMLRWQMEVA